MRSQILWAAMAVLASLAIIPTTDAGFEDVQGNFCRNRKPSECCEDRLDDCEVPIKGTYCYCDEFCLQGDRTHNDCCPDFLEVCMGKTKEVNKPADLQRDEPSKQDCEIGGLKVANGDTVMENCNECRCQDGRLECDEDCCMVDEEIISTINESPTIFRWQATNYPDHWGRKTRDGLKLKTGTFNPQDQSGQMYPVKLNPDVSKIPVTFDARRKTNWAGRVGEVCDQGWCGASWAFSTLGVAQDRVSILARGHGRMELSAQNLLSCAQLGQKGCEGGYMDRAWNYLRSSGIVRESCYQYESGKSGMVPKCLLRRNDVSRLTCELKDRFKMEPAYRISNKEEDIQWEIMTNGPVQAFMTVHSDLFMYKSGVYSYTSLTAMKEPEVDSATHSVRIIGWGMTRMLSSHPIKYWLVANSWGTQWGERGYFRIKRGTNECGIESFILAARAKLANFSYGRGSQVPLLPLPE